MGLRAFYELIRDGRFGHCTTSIKRFLNRAPNFMTWRYHASTLMFLATGLVTQV
jgi:hypothetical protein